MSKLLFYTTLSGSCALCYIAWKEKSFSPETQQWLSFWGMHGIGTLGATLVNILAWAASSRNVFKTTYRTVSWMIFSSTLNEILQFFEPNRVVDMWDIYYQVAGCLIAGALFLIVGSPFSTTTTHTNRPDLF